MRWILLLLALTWLAHPSLAQPPSLDELEDKLGKTRTHLKAEKWRLNVMNEKAHDVSSQLSQTQSKLSHCRARLDQTRARLAAARQRLEALRVSVKRAQARLLQSQVALEGRMRDIYEEGDVSYLSVLLRSKNYTDFLNQSEYLGCVVGQDHRLIAEVRARKAELERQKAAAQKTVAEIAATEKVFARQEADLSALEERRARLLAQVRAERDKVAARVDELEELTQEMESQLQELIRQRQASAAPAGAGPSLPSTGRYIMPVQGWITSPFGYRVHPIRGTTIFHAGLDIAAGSGTPIKAADNGRVIYSGWYGGYGNAIIIDHGDGYSTLYGHCSALYLCEGASVSQGQVIAAVGSTGMSTGPHLHFEVRYNGTPVDPRGRL